MANPANLLKTLNENVVAGIEHPPLHSYANSAIMRLAASVYPLSDTDAEADGTTDDSAAIQGAINAAQAAGGGTVVFEAGKTYAIDSTLEITASNVTLSGDGATIKVLAGASLPNAVYVHGADIDNRIENINIIGLTVDANYGDAGGTQPRGIEVEYSRHVVVSAVRIENSWVSLHFSTGTEYATAIACTSVGTYEDDFDGGGTGAPIGEEPGYLSFIACAARDQQVTCTGNGFELEDGVHDVFVAYCHMPSRTIGIRNHAGTASETENITLIGVVASAINIDNSYAGTGNYVKDVTLIRCSGTITVTGTIEGLTIIGQQEYIFPSYIKIAQTSEPADAAIRNGEASIWFDQATPALKVKAKQSNGTIVTGSVTLST